MRREEGRDIGDPPPISVSRGRQIWDGGREETGCRYSSERGIEIHDVYWREGREIEERKRELR